MSKDKNVIVQLRKNQDIEKSEISRPFKNRKISKNPVNTWCGAGFCHFFSVKLPG